MQLYLSSYKLGNKQEILKEWIKNHGNKIILIANSRDIFEDGPRKEAGIKRDTEALENLGFEVKNLSLKDYFGQHEKLRKELEGYYAFYVIGGNTFSLIQAMKYSGFDQYLKEISRDSRYLYAGYSAGICVLAPRLEGLHLVDEPINPYNSEKVTYQGIGLINYVPVPHYKSDHPESKMADDVVEYMKQKNIEYKTLHDGDVIIENLAEKIKLVTPTKEYESQVMEYKEEFLKRDEVIDGSAGLEEVETYEEWINFEERLSKKYGENYVPSTVCLAIRETDNKLVGIIVFKHRLTDFLFNYGGNIGYSVLPEERQKGYAKEILRLMLERCKELGVGKVLIACDKENIASAKTIISNGGILENEVKDELGLGWSGTIQRYWINIK